VSTALSTGTVDATTYGITSDGGVDDLTLVEATTSDSGLLGAAKWDEIVANSLKDTNVSTALSTGTVDATTYSITSDGGADDLTLVEATTAAAGILGSDKWDEIVANSLKDTNVSTALSTGTVDATSYGITSDGGADDVVLAQADTDNAGVLSAAKWDEIVANTSASHTILTVAAGTDAVALTGQEISADSTVEELADLAAVNDALIGYDGSGNLEAKSSLSIDVILADEAPSEGSGHITYNATDDALRVYDGAAVDDFSNDVTNAAAYEGELDNSAGLLAALDDETGTGVAVFSADPEFTGEIVIDELGIEGQETDSITDCSSFSATGGGIFYDDSEGAWKKCQDNVLTVLDTTGGTPATADISDVSVTQTELAELETIDATTISAAQLGIQRFLQITPQMTILCKILTLQFTKQDNRILVELSKTIQI